MGVSKTWRLTVATAAAAVAFGTIYFYVRQFLKDDIWRFDLTLVNKGRVGHPGPAGRLDLGASEGLRTTSASPAP